MARPKPQYATATSSSFSKISLGEIMARSVSGEVILFPSSPRDSQESLRLAVSYAHRLQIEIKTETISCIAPGRGVDETFRAIRVTIINNPRSAEWIKKYGKAKGYLTGSPDDTSDLSPEDQWNISDEARSAGEPPVELQPVIKRGRGRPRKNPLPDTAQLPLDQPAELQANELPKEN